MNGDFMLICLFLNFINWFWIILTIFLLGRELDSDIMVVAMHSGGIKSVSNLIEYPEKSQRFLKLANVFYSEKNPVKCNNNLKAKRVIKSFLA